MTWAPFDDSPRGKRDHESINFTLTGHMIGDHAKPDTSIKTKGGHHFDSDYNFLADTILKASI